MKRCDCRNRHVPRRVVLTGGPGAGKTAAVVLCDRGTVDCAAYWAGKGDLFSAVGSTPAIELARCHAVVQLRTPTSPAACNRDNPLRLESMEEAAAIDAKIAAQWSAHPRVFVVEPTEDLLHRAARPWRVMSRTEAAEKVSTGQLKGMMRGIVYHEQHVARFRDEAPQAYRDLRHVMRAQSELVRSERALVPLLNDKRW